MIFSTLQYAAATRDHVLQVMVARSMLGRMRGLLARPPLLRGQAMLLHKCNLVHTLGMGYPIDIVFLRRDGLVLRVAAAVPPRRMRGHWRAQCVLELAAGEAARGAIVAGLRLPLGELA